MMKNIYILFFIQMKIKNIEDLKNIPEGITELDISGLELITLPILPQSLTKLVCYGNKLTSLNGLAMVQRTEGNSLARVQRTKGPDAVNSLAMGPEGPDAVKKDARVFCSLPQNLTTLVCWSNELTSLDNLPQGLTSLYCGENQLTSLDNLPSGLTKLDCYKNKLTSLDNLPSGLTSLYCYKNKLTSLDNLPQGLTKLYCSYNQLTSLYNLPSGLTNLYCSNNELTSLYNFPQGLTELICTDNQLTSLYNLPSGLTNLYCSNNELTSLDIANCDKLEVLDCMNNNFPEEMETILDDEDLTIQEKINKLRMLNTYSMIMRSMIMHLF